MIINRRDKPRGVSEYARQTPYPILRPVCRFSGRTAIERGFTADDSLAMLPVKNVKFRRATRRKGSHPRV